MKYLKKLGEGYAAVIHWASMICVFTLTLICFLLVISRYVFHTNLRGFEEMPVYLMMVTAWLGSSIASKDDKHVKVDLVQEFVGSEKIKALVRLAVFILTAAGYVLFTWLAFRYMANSFIRHTTSAALRFPLWYIHAVIFIGSLASAYFFELLLRATALSYLVTILGKQRIGRHSAMCACVVAASEGVAAGAALLLGGGLREVNMAINNTIINVFGVVCDGPRVACALKLSSAAGIAMEGALLAMDGVTIPPGCGVCGHNADESINFMGDFAKRAMMETALVLCKALYEKHQDKR